MKLSLWKNACLFCFVIQAYFMLIHDETTFGETIERIKPGANLQQEIEKLRNKERPAKLILSSGVYHIYEPLHLNEKESGLTISGEGEVIITTAANIKDFKLIDPVKNIWQGNLPKEVDTKMFLHQLWVGNKTCRLAREPDTMWFETKGNLAAAKPVVMTIPATLHKEWEKQGNVQVICLQKWAGFRFPIKSLDVNRKTVTLEFTPHAHRQEETNRFWIENAPEAMNLPGEWYWDQQSRKISLIPLEGKSPDKTIYSVPSTSRFLLAEKCRGLKLENLVFQGCGDDCPITGVNDSQAASSRRGAIQFQNCDACMISHCRVENTGGYGIDLAVGSRNCVIEHSRLDHLGAGGIRIGETRGGSAGEEVSHHLVKNNIIHNYGETFFGACGLILFQTSHNKISYNNIHHGHYTGISAGWNWGYYNTPCHHNVISYNHIHHIGSNYLSDMGGVYLLGPQPGTEVRNNYIHDIICHGYGAWGLYTDEGSSYMMLEGNFVRDTQKAGFHQHYGKENTIRNNVFYHTGEGGIRRSREEEHLSFIVEKNLIINDGREFVQSNYRKGKYHFDNNHYFTSAQGNSTWAGQTWEQWRNKGNDKNSIFGDPLWKDSLHPELGVKPESPAFKLGITIPVIDVDPRTGILKEKQ